MEPAKRTFYSKASHLIVRISNPVKKIQDGNAVDVGGENVAFQPLGDGWGWYVTDKPDEIAVLEKNRLCVSPEVYQDMTTPDHIKVRLQQEENKRLITQQNDLMETIKDLREKAARPAGK